jgi:hypothetical protein
VPGQRREVLGFLAALPLLGGLFGLVDPAEIDAKGRRTRGKSSDHHARDQHLSAEKKRKKKKKCKTTAQVCAGTCGTVRYKCKKKRKTADCGPCACNPPCDACFICNATTKVCQPDPDQQGEPCGTPGQICQAGGVCACDASSCGDTTPICDGESCVACSAELPCPDGCCANDGSCQDGDSSFYCGPDGGVCVECTGVDEVCIEGACAVPACGEFGGPCLVFVTSTASNGNLGGLGGADGTCQDLADAAELPGAYMAWLSTALVNPSNRFVRAQGPYRLVNGVKVAESYFDLTTQKAGGNYLSSPINVTETGEFISNAAQAAAWTFTLPSGQSGSSIPSVGNCLDWTTGAGGVFGAFGNVSSSGAPWTDGGGVQCNNFNLSPFRLYCFQQS